MDRDLQPEPGDMLLEDEMTEQTAHEVVDLMSSSGFEALETDPATPEALEARLEGELSPPEASFHEEDFLHEAIIDEGESVESFDPDEVEWEIEQDAADYE